MFLSMYTLPCSLQEEHMLRSLKEVRGRARQEQTCGLVVLALHCTAKLAVVPGSNLTVDVSRLKSGWPTKRAVYTTALLP